MLNETAHTGVDGSSCIELLFNFKPLATSWHRNLLVRIGVNAIASII